MWAELLISHAWQLVVMVVLLGCSGFFSGTETALFSLSRGQIYRMRRSGSRGAHLVSSLMAHPKRVLNSLLLGNMIVNVAFASLAAFMILDMKSAGAATWVAGLWSVVPLLVLILLGEVAPKMLALVIAERWALLAAGPAALLERLCAPVLRVIDAVIVSPLMRIFVPPAETDLGRIDAVELSALLDLSARRGVIDHDTSSLLREIVELTDIRVGEIMVPRVDMIAFDADRPADGLVELFRRTRLRKIPVFEGDVDHIIGVVHAKHLLLDGATDLRSQITSVPFVPEAGNIERALLQFRIKGTQMAIVVDEYGGTAGLVTMEDILEEIVGDIPDPRDRQRAPAVRRTGGGQYLLDGNLSIHDWADAFKIDLSGKRISTVGGFVTLLLGRIPRVGDVADYRNLRFVVESMRRRRIGTLRLRLEEDVL